MKEISDDFIDSLVDDLSNIRRKTVRDKSKTYYKMTISLNEHEKRSLDAYKAEHGINISQLIREMLYEKGVIPEQD